MAKTKLKRRLELQGRGSKDYDAAVRSAVDQVTRSYDIRDRVAAVVGALQVVSFTRWLVTLEEPSDKFAAGSLFLGCYSAKTADQEQEATLNLATGVVDLKAPIDAAIDPAALCTAALAGHRMQTRNEYRREIKYPAYWSCVTQIKQWVDQFNLEWGTAGNRLHARCTVLSEMSESSSTEDNVNHFGNVNVIVDVVKVDTSGTDGVVPVQGVPDRSVTEWRYAAYDISIDVLSHKVNVDHFFISRGGVRATPEQRKLAEDVIGEKYKLDRKNRTPLGMLSTWTTQFCNIGIDRFTWLDREDWWPTDYYPPRAVCLPEEWEPPGDFTNEDYALAMQMYEVIEHGARHKGYLNNADLRAQMQRALTVYAAVEQTATELGTNLNSDVRARVEQLGIYGFMADGEDLEREQGVPHMLGGESVTFRPRQVRDTCA